MIKTIPQNHFEVNTYILYDETKECALVDVCSQTEAERKEITDFICANGLKVKLILLTHPHTDHLCGAEFATAQYALPLTLAAEGVKIIDIAAKEAPFMGFNAINPENIKTNPIVAGETLRFGNTELQTMDCSGHCPGSLAFYNAAEGYVITGDALFCQSIGRTDLEGGDLDLLLSNLRTKILTLDDAVVVYPGHGPKSTVKDERDYNPFFL